MWSPLDEVEEETILELQEDPDHFKNFITAFIDEKSNLDPHKVLILGALLVDNPDVWFLISFALIS